MQVQHRVHDWTNFAGPVARAYEESRAPVSVIVGPTGGGKSQASARRVMRVALNQYPSPRDGVRKARIVVVCPTYRRAHDTVIPSYLKVWPKEWGKYSGGIGDPVDHVFDLHAPDGTRMHFEVLFRAVRDESLEEFVRGFETTAWWFPEMDTMPAEDLLSLASNRVGRYPEPEDRPDLTEDMAPAYRGVYGDANAPVVGGWFHKRFYLERRKTDRLFRQPSAFDPNAENLHNLRKISLDYYGELAATMEDYDVGRLLKCQPGWARNGKPVHEAFDDTVHVARQGLEYDPETPMVIGADCGNTLKPAAVFGQRDFAARNRLFAEINPRDRQLDLVEFGNEIRRIMDTRFPKLRKALLVVDPSAIAKSTTNRALSYAALLQGTTGIEVQLAPSNDPGVRRSSMDQVLKRRHGLIIDPSCVGLIEAYAGGYRFKKVGPNYQPTPEKNDHSHIAEAGQYYTLGQEGLGPQVGGLISPRARRAHSGPNVILAP